MNVMVMNMNQSMKVVVMKIQNKKILVWAILRYLKLTMLMMKGFRPTKPMRER